MTARASGEIGTRFMNGALPQLWDLRDGGNLGKLGSKFPTLAPKKQISDSDSEMKLLSEGPGTVGLGMSSKGTYGSDEDCHVVAQSGRMCVEV